MQYKNDGKSEEHYIQNRFTAYLQVSLRRKRIEVLAKRYDLMRHETATETNELFPYGQQNEDQLIHNMEVQAKCQQILQALQNMKARERYIFLARVIEERSFAELARELGLGYKGVAAIYYRTLQRLRKEMEDLE